MSKKVLVVDDDPIVLKTIDGVLSDEYDVTTAASALQAMASMGQSKPDLIILDYKMPVCDGPQALEMIRADENLKDIPVIFLTGENDKKHLENVLKFNPAGYLLKPCDSEKLHSLIKVII